MTHLRAGSPDTAAPLVPTPATSQILSEASAALPLDDTRDFDDAARGFIATYESFDQFTSAAGTKVWKGDEFGFVHEEETAGTVHPSLLRLARLNNLHGLFEVVEGMYQIRGFDLANMTIVEGETGLIVIDPLTTAEMARAGLDLYREHRGQRPVRAVIYSHSHADHYGGALGVVDPAEVEAGRVRIIAPGGFVEEAVAENVFAGNAMRRRSQYQFGPLLERGAHGTVDAGIGMGMGAGLTTLLAPTETIGGARETVMLDGVEIEFVQASNTEAPSEFILWFPGLQVLNLVELATHTMHNLLTPRGAVVRDAVAWWKTLHSALVEYGGRAEVLIGQHHWPTWGVDAVAEYIADQRDMYKFVHDESLRRMNHGQTMQELAEEIAFPPGLVSRWHTQGYYGSLNHNSKAIYQHYLGWWDGNPLTYHQHPPTESGARLIRMLGGVDAVLDQLDGFFAEGDYRWVAQMSAAVLFADPDSVRARELGAAALDQMAIQTANASWRNIFLTGAQELREESARERTDRGIDAPTAEAMTDEQILDYAGICFNGVTGAELTVSLTWAQPDAGTEYLLETRNGVLVYTEGAQESGSATITAGRAALAQLLSRPQTEESLAAAEADISGDTAAVLALLAHIDHFPRFFPVTLP